MGSTVVVHRHSLLFNPSSPPAKELSLVNQIGQKGQRKQTRFSISVHYKFENSKTEWIHHATGRDESEDDRETCLQHSQPKSALLFFFFYCISLFHNLCGGKTVRFYHFAAVTWPVCFIKQDEGVKVCHH